MKIKFDNIGAIKKVNLDLSKKLMIFCGPNGTGKTYTAYAVYGFTNLLMVGVPMFHINDLIEKKKLDILLDYDALYEAKKTYVHYINKNISKLFGVNKKKYFENFKMSLLVNKEDFEAEIYKSAFSYTYSYDNVTVKYTKKSNNTNLQISLVGQASLNFSSKVETFHLAKLTKYICQKTLVDSYILPVERNSVYTFISELTLNKIDDKSLIQEDLKSRYPQAIQVALRSAGNLANIKKNASEFESLALKIENEILHGKVLISDDGELQFSPDRVPDKILPVHLTASIIKNLSGLLIYLKHQAMPNELLIIDEPEIGLHPDNQILLARIFAKMINSGLRLLINTHSDYIIREINNLIMLSTSKSNTRINELAGRYNYSSDEFINPDDVGTYLFNYNDLGTVDVESLVISNNGFEVSTIDNSISKLNDLSMELFWGLNQESNDSIG